VRYEVRPNLVLGLHKFTGVVLEFPAAAIYMLNDTVSQENPIQQQIIVCGVNAPAGVQKRL
jgi:hypothetical protein